MYVHTPTGKTCRIITYNGDHAFCNFGAHDNPFAWVKRDDLAWQPEDASACSSDVQIVDFNTSEPEMLAAVIERLRRHQHVQTATIYCQSRKIGGDDDGWLEYRLRVNYFGGGTMNIGCIQRKPAADIEFRS